MKRTLLSILFLPFAVCAVDTNALPPLLPAYPQIQPTFWEQYKILVLASVVAVLFFVGLSIWILLKPKPPVASSPGQVAREALEELKDRPQDGRLLSEVSQIFRRYVGAVFGFPAAEMTTAEFAAALVANPKAGPQVAELLSNFLRACDKDKFMANNTAPPLSAVERALHLVDQIESGWQGRPATKSIPQ
jgi:hypothetical protein